MDPYNKKISQLFQDWYNSYLHLENFERNEITTIQLFFKLDDDNLKEICPHMAATRIKLKEKITDIKDNLTQTEIIIYKTYESLESDITVLDSTGEEIQETLQDINYAMQY